MDTEMIKKLEKAMLYAKEPEQVIFDKFDVTFKGDYRQHYYRGDLITFERVLATKIAAFDLVGSEFCVEAKDGDIIFKAISESLSLELSVEISFQNVEMLTSAFLNTAIGQLYRDFSEEKIRALVKVVDIADADVALLRRVIETAKLYYKDPAWLEESVRRIMGEDE